jgi:pyruvate dehydrogenase E1 component alpha subunit
MHLIDMPRGVMGASAVVGTTIPVAAGYAQALQWDAKKGAKPRIVVAICGDGATEEGCFAETLNYAALKKLPVLFIVENNRFAIHTPIERRQPNWNLRERVATYGIPTDYVGDGDVFAIREKVAAAADKIRAGSGPMFIECETYRWMEHVGPTDDHDSGPYRNHADYARWKANDQIARLATMLGAKKTAELNAAVEAQLKDAITFAENSPYPGADALLRYVYAA